MRSWFRDFFVDTIGNQKLGGYDPYMNEYVLATNGESIPAFSNCLPCGVTENVLVTPGEETIYCVNVTQEVGTVSISYVIPNVYTYNPEPIIMGMLCEFLFFRGILNPTGPKMSKGVLMSCKVGLGRRR